MDSAALPADQDYLYAAGYDDRARPLLLGFGKEGSGVGKLWSHNDDQRLARQQASAAGSILQDREFTYEATPAGKITKRKNTINARTWMDCYSYDDRQRLTKAYTTSHADDCSAAAAGGGDGPYNHAYSYTDDGNITGRVEDGNTITYTYPAPGATSVRPHAPTRLDFPGGGDDLDYTWDANGQLLTRTRGGSTDTFGWDAERRLASIETRNATGSSTASFTYDPDGQRLVRRNVERNVAYFEGHEVSVTNGGHVTTVRTYTLDGAPIATRTASGGDDPNKDQVEYLITDNQGSIELTARNSESSPVVDRTYNPYGEKRTGNDAATNRGWIGQIEDHRTELSYLNARYYDPNLYRFISPDPLYDTTNPQTVNPYSYGVSNPVAFSDPSGMIPLECATGEIECRHTGDGWTYGPTPPRPSPSPFGAPEDMEGRLSDDLFEAMVGAGAIPSGWRSMLVDIEDNDWFRYCTHRIAEPSCTLSEYFLPMVLEDWAGEGDYWGPLPAGGWAVPQIGQGAFVLQREYQWEVEEFRYLGAYVVDDRLMLMFDSVTREWRQEQYAQVGSIGPWQTGISGFDVNDDGDLGLVWSGRTSPSLVPNSWRTNWTQTVEINLETGAMVVQ
jgi:RHS repeat-associated protein